MAKRPKASSKTACFGIVSALFRPCSLKGGRKEKCGNGLGHWLKNNMRRPCFGLVSPLFRTGPLQPWEAEVATRLRTSSKTVGFGVVSATTCTSVSKLDCRLARRQLNVAYGQRVLKRWQGKPEMVGRQDGHRPEQDARGAIYLSC